MQKQSLKKGIYILPNLFTTMNLFCGYFSILASVQARFENAAVAILIGTLFDLLDGKIARATHTTSKFGIEYDSLADLVTFGLAPALLMVLWALEPMGRPGWLAGFLFMACGALRLARFNTFASSSPDFEGLPIPAAAAMNVSFVLLFSRLSISPEPFREVILVMMFGLSFCMVSSFCYKSLKKVSLFKRLTFNKLVGMILVFVAIATEPWILLFGIFLVYVLSGPFISLVLHSSKNGKETQVDKGA
ncbi:CDP-diacylglycerol--serine O-phosphatidyltransferase [Desulfospira joergensenii]|uniref:CDP-diacylglycerol--serine O-phosphatidyltransferase n=1 Tax=Desulfospira joergensenii TaxID=53329 RepID=UPI0003B36E96|nr:CDP-diacylglycerol--serine O-phosphatidyltransferase [Desulfospira joergensenii]